MVMKRLNIFALTIALVVSLASCQDSNKADLCNPYPETINFNILTPGASTKVTSGNFEDKDQIGVYVTDYTGETALPLQISGNRANNVAVDFNGSTWTPQREIYWGGGKSDVYAYYPYISEISDVEQQAFFVKADQTTIGDESTLSGFEASDLLWAKAEGVSRADGTVNLAMKHLMSKLTVKLVAGEDYIGSLPADATVLLHNTVTGARIDFSKGSVSKDPYSGVQTIKMKNLGLRTIDGVQAVVYEAVVVPQMLETSVPFLEINSKSVSYLIEEPFNFRPGTAYTYTATLNASTNSIKVDIGCEIEDWNSTGGDDSGEGEGGDDSGEEDDNNQYTDLSAIGTANCYLISTPGDYRFKSVIGNSDVTVGNVKSVEVLWESFGTDVKPNVGDLIQSVSYKNGYVRFSTPDNFKNGNAVIAAKNSAGVILWSWHIWCAEEGWKEQVYPNDAGTMMDRNLGATSATPGNVGALGLLYQWGRKDPFLGSSIINGAKRAESTGVWGATSYASCQPLEAADFPMTYCVNLISSSLDWSKTLFDPCPPGWKVPEGGPDGVFPKAAFDNIQKDNQKYGFIVIINDLESIWFPTACYYMNDGRLTQDGGSYFWSSLRERDGNPYRIIVSSDISYSTYPVTYGFSVRCVKE